MEGRQLHVVFAEAAKELSRPAGDSPQFATGSAIRTNYEAFVLACHETWKRWHGRAVKEILTWDAFARRERAHPIGPAAAELADYNRAVWRRVNDAIIWTMVGVQRHVVKRICLYRKRGFLAESNPESVMATLAELNADPRVIAIWNDATSCVDLGDITCVRFHTAMEPFFVELKEGKVNAAVLDVLRADAGEFERKFEEFRKLYGKKGVAQLDRVTRQKTITAQALTLLHEEHGKDPVTGAELSVTEIPVAPNTYDAALNRVLTEAADRTGEVTETIDGCLWICANRTKVLNRYQARRHFHDLLGLRFPHLLRAPEQPASRSHDRIVCLNECFMPPLAKPIFLRALEAENVGSVTYGELMFKVFLYLDWQAFGTLIAEEGGQFTWSSAKFARRAKALKRELQPVMVDGRVPQVTLDKATMSITEPMLVQLFFDGLTPRAMAKTIVEAARALPGVLERRNGPKEDGFF